MAAHPAPGANRRHQAHTVEAVEIMAKTEVTVEIEGGDKPALVADWLGVTRVA